MRGEKRELLRHFLAALAYRTQKAVRGAPTHYSDFEAGREVRTPHDIVVHMESVLGYARTHFVGGRFRAVRVEEFGAQVGQLHEMMQSLSNHLESGTPIVGTTPEQLLQGPFSDAMTHAGQLAMLRRLAGSAVPPENFIVAEIHSGNVGPKQPPPASPDADWPEADS